jgi:hypothetical protein
MPRPPFPLPWSLTGPVADALAGGWRTGVGRAVLVTGGLGDGGFARELARAVPGACSLNPYVPGAGQARATLLDGLLAVERAPLVICELRSYVRASEARAWTGVFDAARRAGSVFVGVWYGTTTEPQASAEDAALVAAYQCAADVEIRAGACLYPYEPERGGREARDLGAYAPHSLAPLTRYAERWPRTEGAYLARAVPRLRRLLGHDR